MLAGTLARLLVRPSQPGRERSLRPVLAEPPKAMMDCKASGRSADPRRPSRKAQDAHEVAASRTFGSVYARQVLTTNERSAVVSPERSRDNDGLNPSRRAVCSDEVRVPSHICRRLLVAALESPPVIRERARRPTAERIRAHVRPALTPSQRFFPATRITIESPRTWPCTSSRASPRC